MYTLVLFSDGSVFYEDIDNFDACAYAREHGLQIEKQVFMSNLPTEIVDSILYGWGV